jgi:hypothetical protein
LVPGIIIITEKCKAKDSEANRPLKKSYIQL